MKQAIIFANGRMEVSPTLTSEIQTSSLVVAADGGIHNCKSLGIQPNIIIGDLDSIPSDELTIYHDTGVEVIRYPTRKNETDLELALQYTLKHDVSEVIIIGGLGARWDMTLTNILLLAHPIFAGLKIRLLDGNQELVLLQTGVPSVMHGQPGDNISLIPLAGDVSGVITEGLEYPLKNETLKFGSSRGVSNVFIQEQAQVIYREGILLCILIRNVTLSTLPKKESNREE